MVVPLVEDCQIRIVHGVLLFRRFGTHFVELSYEWRDDNQGLLTYRSSRAGTYILWLVHSLQDRCVSYFVVGHDVTRGELNIVEHDGMGYFVSSDQKRLTIEEVGQRLIELLIATSNKPSRQ